EVKWIGETRDAVAQALARIVCEQVEDRIEAMDLDVTDSTNKITKCNDKGDDLEARSDMRHDLGDDEVPYEQRVLTYVDNLGPDTLAMELETRCAQLLLERGFAARTAFSSVASTREESGSAFDVVCTSPRLLARARALVKSTRRKFPRGRAAWHDALKTGNELKPNRPVHRANEILEQFETGRADEQEASKDVPAKCAK
ncbi:unnamed protein product, partial [Prorocentrum cordatum]